MDAMDDLTRQDRKLLAAPARHGFRSDERRRDVRRAINMARLLDFGMGDNVVPLPRRDRAPNTEMPAGASATILLFTGIRRERHA